MLVSAAYYDVTFMPPGSVCVCLIVAKATEEAERGLHFSQATLMSVHRWKCGPENEETRELNRFLPAS